MKFIPATDDQLFKLSCTTRRSSSRTTSGARFIANDRGLVAKAKKQLLILLKKMTTSLSTLV